MFWKSNHFSITSVSRSKGDLSCFSVCGPQEEARLRWNISILHSSLWGDLFCVIVWTHEQRYQRWVAPAVTLLFCLWVISLKSLICSFVNLFSCCWHKSEWFHRPGQASESVAFGAAGFKMCLFSLRRKRRSRQLTFLTPLLSIKPSELRFSLFWLMVSMRETIAGRTVRAKVTFVPAWVPIERI